ncbi:unnamed protein product [Paramecium pentaurelia]|uniref:Transmembrane protein n=1 Tax=Paramecium pentaurelia TaxID=43138 RepID=A0A8S1VSE2_9CILI|nr:unnamed protein product [Paramecium pentaurelia]
MKKEKKKQKLKSSLDERFIEFYIQVRVLCEHYLVKFNSAIINIVLIFSTIQELSFLLLNYQEGYFERGINFFTFIREISLASRIKLSSNNEFKDLSYLIPLCITLLYQIVLIYLFIIYLGKNKKQYRLSEFLKTQNRLIQILLKILSYYHSLLYYILIIPMMEFTLESLFHNAQSSSINMIHLSFSIITLIFVIANFLIQLFCNLESISITPLNLQLLQATFSNYWKSLLNLIIIVIDQMESSNLTKFYLIFSITLIKQSSNFWALIWSYPNLHHRQKVEIQFNFFQITIAIILFINQVSEQKQDTYDVLLILLISPILNEMIYNYEIKQHESLMITNSSKITADMLQYKIGNIIYEYGNLQSNYLQETKKITYIHYIKQTHLDECEDSKCLCRRQIISFEDVINLYLKDQVKNFDIMISRIKDDSARQSYFLHYLSLINYLGLNTKAFQQSNFLAQLDSEQIQFSSSATHGVNYQFNHQQSDRKEQNNSSDGKSHSMQKSKSGGDKSAQSTTHIRLNNMGFIARQKLNLIQEQIKQSMSMGFSKQSAQVSENLEHAVKLFLQSEDNNKRLRKKVVKMINRKREFFNNLNQLSNELNIFEAGKKLLIQMNTLEDQLYKLYDQFPSQKMQALNTFYQSEIMNNYFSAYKLATIASISDEKLLKMQSQTNFDLFSNKIDYLIIGFDQQSHKLSIRSGSNMIHQFFGLSQDSFKMISLINSILPQGFEIVHEKLVANFLQHGVSKYFRQINLNFCQYQQRFIKTVDFFYDINFMNLDDLTFACFLQNVETQSVYLFSLSNHKVSGISKNFINKLGYSNKLNKELAQAFQRVPLSKVFPKISLILEANITKASDVNQDIIDVTQISEYSILMYVPIALLLENNSKINWENQDHLTNYQVDCILHIRNFKTELSYIIIEIKEIKKQSRTENTTPEPQMTLGYNSNQEFESFNAYEIDQEDIEYAVNMPKAIELYGLEDQTANLENLDNLDQFDYNINKLRVNDKSLNQSYQQPYQNQSMMSPKDSGLRLIENKNPDFNVTQIKSKQLGNKQQFFKSVEQIEQEEQSSSFQQSSEIKKQQMIENQVDKLQYDDIDQELQENIRMQMQMDSKEQRIVHIDDIGSQVSSIAGLKKSKYSKKYDLIEKLINSTKFSKKFKIMLVFQTLMFSLFLVYSGVMLYYSNDDLNRFLEELDLIQIKSNIIGPVNKYIVSQNSLTTYAVLLLLYPNITLQSQIGKMQYSIKDINYTYFELKDSFTKQLSNPYLNPFFEDKYFNIMVGKYPNTSNYSISARESMYLYLEACYNFVNIDYLNIINLDITQGFLVFLYANYQTFVEQLQLLNEEMVNYSIIRSGTVSEKWNYLLIPIVVVCFFLLLIGFTFYKAYLNQYDNFLQLFNFIDVVWLQRDIDRYRGIASLLIKDSDVLFKYQFDIDIKEKFLAAEDIRKEKIAQNQKNNKQKQKGQIANLNQKMSILPSLSTFTFIFGICFIFCFITNSLGRNYFQKYPDTTTFFNSLSDLCIAVSGVFSMREVTYYQKFPLGTIFYFLPDKNATFFVQNFFDQIDIINNFLSLIVQMDRSKYITSDDFISEMDSMMSTDVCQFLPANKIEMAQNHCDAVYQGVLRKGFQAAGTTIRNDLLNEYNQTNGFVLKVYTPQEELEAGLILYDTISVLKQQFQSQLKNSTDELISQILIINLIFIILMVLTILLIFTKILSYFKWEFNLMKRFLLLLPQQSLFLDNQLDRTIRQMVVKDDLT